MKKFILIFGFAGLLSCQDIENCDTNDELSVFILEYVDRTTNQAVKTNFLVTASDSPYLFPPFEDSTGIALPLNPNAESVTFYFDSLGSSSRYELQLSYEAQLSIFDEKCDPSITFINLDTVSYTFDSLSIPGRITNRQLSTNVQVFF